jgi:hypothetical protein
MLEMKLLLVGIYSRYSTTIDLSTQVNRLPSQSVRSCLEIQKGILTPWRYHSSSRTSFRDVNFFPDMQGIIAFERLVPDAT